jgi:ABC-2 type transport system ATP-binding protein
VTAPAAALECAGLGRRYRRSWALRDCTLAVPAGRVVALVGPNGAGKSTLLNLAAGLITPSAGTVRVLGAPPGSGRARAGVSFVAQDAPLYPYLSVADTFRFAGRLSPRWDQARAERQVADLGIGLQRRVGELSGGQHAQVALAVAVARRPELLILDEPVARLDPLARHDLMAALMAAVAEDGVSVLLSSHLLADLERVCDYLVVLAAGAVQLCGGVEDLLAGHRLLTGPTGTAAAAAAAGCVVEEHRASGQTRLLARTRADRSLPPGWAADPISLDELVLAYLRSPGASALPGPLADLSRSA